MHVMIQRQKSNLLFQHNLGHEHVLQCGESRGVIYGVILLERLVEVGESCLEVPLLGRVQDPGLQVKLGLEGGGWRK